MTLFVTQALGEDWFDQCVPSWQPLRAHHRWRLVAMIVLKPAEQPLGSSATRPRSSPTSMNVPPLQSRSSKRGAERASGVSA
jgi:hypothetical protein